jgi:hypothetical protein
MEFPIENELSLSFCPVNAASQARERELPLQAPLLLPLQRLQQPPRLLLLPLPLLLLRMMTWTWMTMMTMTMTWTCLVK